jgi:hypothetical protein
VTPAETDSEAGGETPALAPDLPALRAAIQTLR